MRSLSHPRDRISLPYRKEHPEEVRMKDATTKARQDESQVQPKAAQSAQSAGTGPAVVTLGFDDARESQADAQR